jgi:hypothetical protein
LTWTQQLFSAAIQSGVARSERLLGKQNVFSIDTDIDTFDFPRALNEGLDSHYRLVSSTFDSWLSNWLKSHGPIDSIDPTHQQKLVRPTLSDTRWMPAIVRELDDRLRTEPSTSATHIANYDVAIFDDGGQFNGTYRSRAIKNFTVIRPTNVLQFDFQIGPRGSFAAANLGCSLLNKNGVPLDFVTHVQEMPDTGDGLRSFRVYFQLNQPLLPDSANQPYRVEYQYEGDDPYQNLGVTLEAATLSLRQGDTVQAVLCVAFPQSKLQNPRITDVAAASADQLRLLRSRIEGEQLVASTEMERNEMLDVLGIDVRLLSRYHLVGRKVGRTPQGGCFGFIID